MSKKLEEIGKQLQEARSETAANGRLVSRPAQQVGEERADTIDEFLTKVYLPI